jgi:hypothetical protein
MNYIYFYMLLFNGTYLKKIPMTYENSKQICPQSALPCPTQLYIPFPANKDDHRIYIFASLTYLLLEFEMVNSDSTLPFKVMA